MLPLLRSGIIFVSARSDELWLRVWKVCSSPGINDKRASRCWCFCGWLVRNVMGIEGPSNERDFEICLTCVGGELFE